MAISLRRAVVSRCYFCLLTARTSRPLSCFCSTPRFRCSSPRRGVDDSPLANFRFESRRCFAKGRRQWDYGDGDGVSEVSTDDDGNYTEVVDVGANVKSTAVSQMEAAIAALSHELSKLRTGRASAGMLDHILVETGGVKMSLNRMATVSVLDPKTLSVTPYNPDTIKELEKAIVSSPLGLNPKADGQRLIATIPPMTKEHIQAVCKVVAKSSEEVKQSIRRARQKALDIVKKSPPKKVEEKGRRKEKDKEKQKEKNKENVASAFSADDAKRMEKEIEELTKKFVKSAEDMCKAKEKEITSS